MRPKIKKGAQKMVLPAAKIGATRGRVTLRQQDEIRNYLWGEAKSALIRLACNARTRSAEMGYFQRVSTSNGGRRAQNSRTLSVLETLSGSTLFHGGFVNLSHVLPKHDVSVPLFERRNSIVFDVSVYNRTTRTNEDHKLLKRGVTAHATSETTDK